MARIDFSSPTANMYGCEPCPEYGKSYRYVMRDFDVEFPRPLVVLCDDCGLKQPLENPEALS